MTRRREKLQVTKLKRTYNRQTATFTFNISYQTSPTQRTQRTSEVAEAFGLGEDKTQQFTLYDNIKIRIGPTDIVLITGDSGSPKTPQLRSPNQNLLLPEQNQQNPKALNSKVLADQATSG